MSSVKTWLTQEEVLRGVSEGYVLIGDAPPPVRFEAEDDEMVEQFGDSIRTQGDITCNQQPPDLIGITNLLRMVKGSEDEDDENVNSSANLSDCVIAITKPSILNPNVKEFVPKSVTSSHSFNSKSGNSKCAEKNVETTVQTNENQQCDEVSRSSSSMSVRKTGVEKSGEKDKLIDSLNDKLSVNNDQELAKKLKSDASNSNSDFVSTKRKNVAITALLKLYANNNNIEGPKKPQPIKLITPDFFQNPIEVSVVKEAIQRPSPLTIPDKVVQSITPSLSKVEKSNPEVDVEMVKESVSNFDPDDDIAMKKSIKKVRQWLNEPTQEKKTPPSLSLGPICFKRKEIVTSKSSLNSDTDEKKLSKPNEPKQYQPSNYAADLGKKYMAKNTIKEKQKVNMWKDLHVILKEKDEILIKKIQEQANMTSDSETQSSE